MTPADTSLSRLRSLSRSLTIPSVTCPKTPLCVNITGMSTVSHPPTANPLTLSRRMKCEDLRVNEALGTSSCKVCRENREDCKFEAPVKKR